MAVAINIVNGSRPGSYLHHYGYYYHMKGEKKHPNDQGSKAYLRCVHYAARQCHGSAIITNHIDGGKVWLITQNHLCAPHQTYAEVCALRQMIIREATQTNFETLQLVERIRGRFSLEVSSQVTLREMRSAVQRARARFASVETEDIVLIEP